MLSSKQKDAMFGKFLDVFNYDDEYLNKNLDINNVIGKKVSHEKFGIGIIEWIHKKNKYIRVRFESGIKQFPLSSTVDNNDLKIID